jgi:hypothetical protein
MVHHQRRSPLLLLVDAAASALLRVSAELAYESEPFAYAVLPQRRRTCVARCSSCAMRWGVGSWTGDLVSSEASQKTDTFSAGVRSPVEWVSIQSPALVAERRMYQRSVPFDQVVLQLCTTVSVPVVRTRARSARPLQG